MPSWDWIKDLPPVLVPIGTFVAGFLVSRWTLSKKDRKDIEHRQFETGKTLMIEQREQFGAFTAALRKYTDKPGDPTLEDFTEIAVAGERYFYQLKITCLAILAGQVDPGARDGTLVPHIAKAVKVNLPSYYAVLQSIAAKRGFEYSGTLERSNFESLYTVVEKFAALD